MTPYPFSKLRVNEMEEGNKQENAKENEVIVISYGNNKNAKEGDSLQEAFKKFRKERQKAIRLSKQVNEESIQWRADPKRMNNLRMKFVEQCKQYFGVPYAKKYQEPGTAEHNSPLFLDCCGLIRRALRDLKEDFGFEIGPWNQAYMFDTLPLDVENTADMKPGDLVFVSGIYHNPKYCCNSYKTSARDACGLYARILKETVTRARKQLDRHFTVVCLVTWPLNEAKKQRLSMVHVEVWAGDGDKTIGARWQRGKVQYHDSYKFNAKSYHSMKYHFKSIDTWLRGVCKSHCLEHAWKRSKYEPGKKSIFAEEQLCETPDEDAEEEADLNEQVQCSVVDQKSSCDLTKNYWGYPEKNHNVGQDLTSSSAMKKPVAFYSPCNASHDISTKSLTNVIPEHQRMFHDLDECVHWLLSKITFDLENELYYQSIRCGVEEPDSLNTESKDFYGIAQRNVDLSALQRNTNNSCSCPQCSPLRINCMHQNEYNFDSSESSDEDESRSSQDSIDLSSSLECFDLIDGSVVSSGVGSTVHCPNNSNGSSERSTERSFSPSKAGKRGKESGNSFSPGKGQGNEKDRNKNGRDSPRQNSPGGSVGRLSNGKQPTFFIGGKNGNWMIESSLVSLGWSKVEDKMDDSFKLKWVECKSQINYSTFKDGEQLVNHIPNINLLTTKLGLLSSLQEYQRVQDKMAARSASKLPLSINEFVPETYKLMNSSEKMKFVNEVYKDGETWICKPTGMNQGKGIYLISSKEQLMGKLNINGEGSDSTIRRSQMPRPLHGRVIQRYVMNPLLLNGFKFDVRTYMLIASTTPFVVFYHPGYVRLSCVPYTQYTQDTAGLHAHLTNQYVQKKHPMYATMKEETVWSFDRLQSYIDEKYATEKGLPENWVYTAFTKRMHQIMTTCFHSVRQKLHRRSGTFDLLGFDFLIDEDFKVWLLEVNINPALHTNCQVLMDLLPGLVDETLKLVIEISEKRKKKRSLFPLENQTGFQLLYNGEGK